MSLTPNYYPYVLERLRFDDGALLASAACSFAVGYMQYACAIMLPMKGGKGPMPFWMHSFYLAHDSTFRYLMGAAAPEYNDHWFLRYTSIALEIWSLLEIWCIFRAVTKDRNAVFSDLMGPNPRLGPVLWYVTAQQVAWFAIVILGIRLMGEGCFMQWFCITNVGMAVGPLHEYMRRGSREGLSIWLCAVNIMGTILTFAPFGMWVMALPEVFDCPEYYMVGAALTCYCTWGFYIVAQYDAKPLRLRQ
ncbi:hypothetical protein F5883DRAFT_718612 [Diaporthe sp. PMI_573]|nr:hypothetical protein F5883DRAFT_718612 [Diaporthaceae sp. PMI_573]